MILIRRDAAAGPDLDILIGPRAARHGIMSPQWPGAPGGRTQSRGRPGSPSRPKFKFSRLGRGSSLAGTETSGPGRPAAVTVPRRYHHGQVTHQIRVSPRRLDDHHRAVARARSNGDDSRHS